MKKLLLSIALVSAFLVEGQILQQENFNTFNTATIVGQGTPAYAKLNGVDADYMVVTTGNASNGLAITGAATSGAGTSRYLWKDGLNTVWAARTAGNNIIQIEYDFFTGGTSTSNNGGGVELYDITYEKYLGGLTMHAASKTILGLHMDTSVTPNVLASTNLGAGTTNVTLPANSWVRVGFAYNSITGAVTYKGPGFYKTVTGVVDMPHEIDYAVQNLASTNAASFINNFDNLVAKAVATESLLLSTNEFALQSEGIEVYPNPTVDFIKINSKTKILATYIYDMSGIRVDAKLVDGKIDVRSLPSGAYMLGLKTANGLITTKFLKK